MSEEYQKITIPEYLEYQKLKQENARLREALEWYADNKNCANPDSCFIYEIDKDGEEIADEGYTARQALAEADKIQLCE